MSYNIAYLGFDCNSFQAMSAEEKDRKRNADAQRDVNCAVAKKYVTAVMDKRFLSEI